ncbi:hypothetical protein BDD12DRAFT_889431 [Trichophaea hybrida]|nr:hypothetical protein BDD12DRAFT_889431 [Trichophaea hybrida]
MVRNFDPNSFCSGELHLNIPVGDEGGFQFIQRYHYRFAPDEHLLLRVELYDGHLQIISTRMGRTRLFHNIISRTLRKHLLQFSYDMSLFKEATIRVDSTKFHGTRYVSYTADAGVSCSSLDDDWVCLMVEVTNGEKYAELETKRSRWQHASSGKIKTILLMTYEIEDVAAKYTCVLEVRKTARQATPKDP